MRNIAFVLYSKQNMLSIGFKNYKKQEIANNDNQRGTKKSRIDSKKDV